MSQEAAFWDSSALTPQCVWELASAHCDELSEQYSAVVWWAAVVEVRSALARSQRSGKLNAVDHQNALDRLTVLQVEWQEIMPSDGVRDKAVEMLDRFPLRAADSLQLAAAMVWSGDKPIGRKFICGDIRLSEAASALGFSVLRP